VGRAARNVNGRAIFYADRITGSMERCMEETARRREIQMQHNAAHGIVPHSVEKSVDQVRFITRVADAREEREENERKREGGRRARVAEREAAYDTSDPQQLLERLEAEMKEAALALDFEAAARLRDQLFELKARMGDGAKAAANKGGGKSDGARGGRDGGRRSGRGAESRAGR
jgi:excinuclease ABC subunit B